MSFVFPNGFLVGYLLFGECGCLCGGTSYIWLNIFLNCKKIAEKRENKLTILFFISNHKKSHQFSLSLHLFHHQEVVPINSLILTANNGTSSVLNVPTVTRNIDLGIKDHGTYVIQM